MASEDAAERSPDSDEEERFVGVLRAALDAMEASDIVYVLTGGIASAVLGRPRVTRDIDLFVRAEDFKAAVQALDAAGFDTREPELDWLYKASKDDIQVDIIFKSSGDIYLDEEMEGRAVKLDYKGVPVRLMPAEDLLVTKALSHDEETPQYWHDALAVIASNELDWDYVVHRARHGAKRVLSLLIYAQSDDLIVPDGAIRRLFDEIYEA
jgi:predicted nucleotidyltransferase